MRLFANAKVLKNIREDRKIIEVFIANQNAQADEILFQRVCLEKDK